MSKGTIIRTLMADKDLRHMLHERNMSFGRKRLLSLTFFIYIGGMEVSAENVKGERID
jgi:hypothetical protein